MIDLEKDYMLGVAEGDASIAREQARYWGMVNGARDKGDVLEWDGLLCEAVLKARAESDPTLLMDLLEDVADIAIAYASSVRRQTADFDADVEADQSEEDGE